MTGWKEVVRKDMRECDVSEEDVDVRVKWRRKYESLIPLPSGIHRQAERESYQYYKHAQTLQRKCRQMIHQTIILIIIIILAMITVALCASESKACHY